MVSKNTPIIFDEKAYIRYQQKANPYFLSSVLTPIKEELLFRLSLLQQEPVLPLVIQILSEIF